MKKTFLNILIVFAFIFPLALWAASDLYLANQEFMSLEKASVLWGHKPLSMDGFKKGDVKVRSSMAVSIIENKIFIGKTPEQVKKLLATQTDIFGVKTFLPIF